MTTHEAVVYQAVNVARRWRARCDECGWTGTWTSDVRTSREEADDHNGLKMDEGRQDRPHVFTDMRETS